MARISLKCVCGWNFFIAGTAQGHEALCPNCGDGVAIPGRKATGGGPKSPGMIAAEKQARQKLIAVLVSIGTAIFLVAIVMYVATSGAPQPKVVEPNVEEHKPEADRKKKLSDKVDPGSQPHKDRQKPDGPSREMQVEKHKKDIQANVWRLNLAGITMESLRLRNHADAANSLQERRKTWEAKIIDALKALMELDPPAAKADPYIQPGDRLVVFAQKELAVMRPEDADLAVLSPWLRSFQPGALLEQAVILRGTLRIELILQFPESSEELQGIARLPDIHGDGRYEERPPGSPPGSGAPIPSLSGPIPDSVLKDIETGFAEIPPGYRSLLSPFERGRLETLAKAKTGSFDDHSFLTQRILGELLPAYQREAAAVRAKADDLQAKIAQTTAVDVVHFKDGRKVTGQVVAQDEKEVKVRGKFGAVTISTADVARIEFGKGKGLEFPKKLIETARTAQGLAGLLGWCQTNELRLEADYTAALLLTVDPLHEAARKISGLPARPAPKGVAPAPAPGPMAAPALAGDQISKTVDQMALDVVRGYPGFGDVLAQMRARSIGLAFALAPVPPPRSARAASLIQDPLSFDLTQLDASGALEIGQWWGSLPLEDRREFARYFGLWCSHRRQSR